MVEENAKKIETLTRIAKLLGEQVREQNKKIETLTRKITELKEHLNQISPPKVSVSPQREDKYDFAPTTSFPKIESQIQELDKLKSEKPTGIFVEKSSEKEELLKALKVIDDL